MFSTLPKIIFNFSVTFILLSANAFNLDQSKILSFGKVLSSLFTEHGPYGYREYVDSVDVHQKYLIRLGQLIIFEPWRENYFSQPS